MINHHPLSCVREAQNVLPSEKASDGNCALGGNEVSCLLPFVKTIRAVKACCSLHIPPHPPVPVLSLRKSTGTMESYLQRRELLDIFTLAFGFSLPDFSPCGFMYILHDLFYMHFTVVIFIQSLKGFLLFNFAPQETEKGDFNKSQNLGNNISQVHWGLIFITSTGFSTSALYKVFFIPFQFSLNQLKKISLFKASNYLFFSLRIDLKILVKRFISGCVKLHA